VYPLGVSPSEGAIVGVEQRMGGSLYPLAPPSFDAVPSAQPILPCLLRHLLAQRQEGALAKAVALARASQGRPHFLHSLEWLLFTALEAQSAAARQRRKRGTSSTAWGMGSSGGSAPAAAGVVKDGEHAPDPLEMAVKLIRHFAEFVEVRVAPHASA
jgi:hypothetical protein